MTDKLFPALGPCSGTGGMRAGPRGRRSSQELPGQNDSPLECSVAKAGSAATTLPEKQEPFQCLLCQPQSHWEHPKPAREDGAATHKGLHSRALPSGPALTLETPSR